LTGHTDSVVAAGWSFDGEMVSTGGMDGRVRVWRRVKRDSKGGVEDWKNWEFLTTLETGSEITVRKGDSPLSLLYLYCRSC
jgi:ribosome assembly protein SQT1